MNVIARSEAMSQSVPLKTRFLTEPALSRIDRFLAALEMTSEGFGMTILKALSIRIAQFGTKQFSGLFDYCV